MEVGAEELADPNFNADDAEKTGAAFEIGLLLLQPDVSAILLEIIELAELPKIGASCAAETENDGKVVNDPLLRLESVEAPNEKIFGVADIDMLVRAFSDDFFGTSPLRFFSFLSEPVASDGFISLVAVL